MQQFIKLSAWLFSPLLLIFAVPLSETPVPPLPKTHYNFPYKSAGLTREEAAAHLLSRFTFGARPGDVERVAEMGLENWFQQQLEGQLPDDSLELSLQGYDALKMSNEQIVATFPKGGQILRMAVRDGLISKDSVQGADKKDYRAMLAPYLQQKGYKPEAELFRQLINQKILRAALSNNQLKELLTDFWFNHFNVSLTKNDCAQFVLAYERDAIRPHVTGLFETLLLATAHSPAMLTYLDNFSSSGPVAQNEKPAQAGLRQRMMKEMMARAADTSRQAMQQAEKIQKARKAQGLNENYAREIMELHTLGVDGGYTQSDVTQAARVLTGWTIYPIGDYGVAQTMRPVVQRLGEDRLTRQGFVHEGDFLFAANRHDREEKTILGNQFPAGGGYEEGVQLLHILAHHPSTARFICTKLAMRFCSDNPSPALISKMEKTFGEKDGNIGQVLITMACAPEFWSNTALRQKTKSPFELAISSVRALNAKITMPYQLFNWINKMGQKIYYYQAPTGFPDRGQYWINTGSLLNRMNFGLALSSQRIPGISFSLLALNQGHEPESAESALLTYSKLLMPGRDLQETVHRLTPLLNDPELNKKINAAAEQKSMAAPPVNNREGSADSMMEEENKKPKERPSQKGGGKNNFTTMQMQVAPGNNSMLAQVVGIVIGSPEFQRK
ncbi:MAG: DUF1800 domain-containing protein [Williamsia sp.]|nr:DUF1800 domain-containing protein [Williamsia sp.]